MKNQVQPRTKKEGSFLVIALSPRHYTYARKMRGRPSYIIYDILAINPLHRKDLPIFSQQSVLLDVDLEVAPSWPSLGWLPMETDRCRIDYAWAAYPLPVTLEESRRGVRNPETEYFLVTSWFDAATNIAHSKQTPAKPEDLAGLQRWGLATPAKVEEKLRLHHGITPSGDQINATPLNQQPPW